MESEESTKKKDVASENIGDTSEADDNWFTSGTSWGYSWLKTATEKAASTLSLVKKDLTEFGDAVANEANLIASTTVDSLQHIVGNSSTEKNEASPDDKEEIGNSGFNWTDKIPQFSSISNNSWMRSFVDVVKSIAQEDTISDENENTELIFPRSACGNVLVQVDLKDPRLIKILLDERTYSEKPEGDEVLYEIWKNYFNLGDYNDFVNSLLGLYPQLRCLYEKMVPSVLSEVAFWQRCLYEIRQKVLIDICEKDLGDVDLATNNFESKDSDKAKNTEKMSPIKMPENSQKEECSSDSRSNADETWSICSSTNMEIQELNESSDGQTTPKVLSASNVGEKSSGWVNWDE